MRSRIPSVPTLRTTHYGCYTGFGELLTPGKNLDSEFPTGDSFSFPMPSDVITKHKGSASGVP